MSENAPQHEPKLSEADIIIGTILMLALDAGDWFEAGVPGTDLVGFPTEQIFLNKKGVKGTTALIGNAIELIPGVDYLPVRTIAWLITVWMDRHPSEFSEKIEQVGEQMQKAEGKAGAGQGALRAEGAATKEAAAVAEQGTATLGTQKEGEAGAGGAAEQKEGDVAKKESGSTGSAGEKTTKESTIEAGHGIPEESGDEKQEEKKLSPEAQELNETLSGDYVGRSIRENLGTEQFLSGIGDEELGVNTPEFDPEKMGPEMEIKPTPKWAAANDNQEPKNTPKGIINNEQINLKNVDGKENKKLLQDAA